MTGPAPTVPGARAALLLVILGCGEPEARPRDPREGTAPPAGEAGRAALPATASPAPPAAALAGSTVGPTVAGGAVPFEAGLRLSYTVADLPGEPDSEAHLTVVRSDSAEAELRIHWLRAPAGKPVARYKYERPLSRRERQAAMAFHFFAGSADRSHHRGYAWKMLSRRMLDRLRQGAPVGVTLLTGVDAAPMRGTLERKGDDLAAFGVLLDGLPVEIPVVPVIGRFEEPGTDIVLEMLVLDDTAAPWILRIDWSTTRSGHERTGWEQVTAVTTPRAAAGVGRELEAECVTTRHDILFATASAVLDTASAPVLAAIAAALGVHPDWELTIVGHTDDIGTAEANLDLSRRRAASVRAALVDGHGITAARLRAEGRGESQPVADNSTVAGRARNRRVDLERNCDRTSGGGQ